MEAETLDVKFLRRFEIQLSEIDINIFNFVVDSERETQPFISIKKPCRCAISCFCACCSRPTFIVESLIEAIGKIVEIRTICDPILKIYDINGAIDLSKSIYIDWGAFVSAVVDFFLITFILFLIVKAINKSGELLSKTSEKIQKGIPNHEEKKMLKKEGISLKDRVAVKK